MDTKTGEIIPSAEFQKMIDILPCEEKNKFDARYREMQIIPTLKQLARTPPTVGRNDPCPCGSGKKFKRCCYTGR